MTPKQIADGFAKKYLADFEREKEAMEKMTQEQKTAYFAAKGAFKP